jgi:hypothetical protein
MDAEKVKKCAWVQPEVTAQKGLKREILIKLRYESFDGNTYETPFRFGVDDQQQPGFTLMAEN